MREHDQISRSGLFAIELLMSAGVFILCASVCIGLFVRAELISADSADLTHAVAEVRNAAECWKAAGGDLAATARLCGETAGQDGLCLYYGADWSRTSSEAENGFRITLLPRAAESGVRLADITACAVGKRDAPLLSWCVAAWPEVEA